MSKEKDPTQEVEVLRPEAHEVAERPQGAMPIEAFIGQAIEKGLPVETIEKFLAMRRELRAEAAKEAYDAAMSQLQGEMPVIEKTKKVFQKNSTTQVRYKYAPIDAIIEQTKEYISRNGFSYAITTEQSETVGEVKAICTVKHRLGHSEVSTFRVPIDNDAYMTAPQKVGAALTFAKRYAFCNAFGIITGDEDTDANETDEAGSHGTTPPPASQKAGGASQQAPSAPKGSQVRNPDEPASEAQLRAVATLRSKYGMPEAVLKSAYKIMSTKELTKGRASQIIDELKKRVDAGHQWEDPNLPKIELDENTFDDTGIDMSNPPSESTHTGEQVPKWRQGKYAPK